MKSSVTQGSRKQLAALPADVHEQAGRAYALWRSYPYHPSLQFKQVSRRQPIYSVRVGIGYRALGLWEEGCIFWFWIGSHAQYDELLKRLWGPLPGDCMGAFRVKLFCRSSPVS